MAGAFRYTGVHDGDFEHNVTRLLADKHKIRMFEGRWWHEVLMCHGMNVFEKIFFLCLASYHIFLDYEPLLCAQPWSKIGGKDTGHFIRYLVIFKMMLMHEQKSSIWTLKRLFVFILTQQDSTGSIFPCGGSTSSPSHRITLCHFTVNMAPLYRKPHQAVDLNLCVQQNPVQLCLTFGFSSLCVQTANERRLSNATTGLF